MKNVRPQEHRALLMDAMRGLIDGTLPINTANALAQLSSELHASIDQEWRMRVYMHENQRADAIEHRPTLMLEKNDETV